MNRIRPLALVVFLVGAAPAARAGVVHYLGPHPLAPGVGKGMCYIEGPHVHSYFPHKALLYVRTGSAYVFIGDPVEFEVDAEAPRYAYYGPHPVFWISPGHRKGHAYCYIQGPHFHFFAPPPAYKVKFKRKGGVFWWVGGHPKWYRRGHWRGRALGRYYKHAHFARPVVRVGPPVGWVGVVVPAPAVRVRVRPGKVLIRAQLGGVFGFGMRGMGPRKMHFKGPRHHPMGWGHHGRVYRRGMGHHGGGMRIKGMHRW